MGHVKRGNIRVFSTREIRLPTIDSAAGLGGSKLDRALVESVVSQEYVSLMMLYASRVRSGRIFNRRTCYTAVANAMIVHR